MNINLDLRRNEDNNDLIHNLLGVGKISSAGHQMNSHDATTWSLPGKTSFHFILVFL